MLLSNLISESCVLPNLPGKNKADVLFCLSDELARVVSMATTEQILELFNERELLGSTGIGNGIAIPHGRISGLKEPVAILGRSLNGVEFDASDGKPVHLFIGLLSPAGAARPHLEALSLISKLLKKPKKRMQMLDAKDKKTLYRVVIMEENQE